MTSSKQKYSSIADHFDMDQVDEHLAGNEAEGSLSKTSVAHLLKGIVACEERIKDLESEVATLKQKNPHLDIPIVVERRVKRYKGA